jgi:hypothetical protein
LFEDVTAVLACEHSIGDWAEQMLVERVKLCPSSDINWPSEKTHLILFEDLITFLFYEVPEDRVRLPICLPRSICRCDRAFDCSVVRTVNLLKHVANGTRQGNTRDPI